MSNFYPLLRAFATAAHKSFPYVPYKEIEKRVEAAVFELSERYLELPIDPRNDKRRKKRPYQPPSSD